jgi:hypothetical protein
MPSKVDTRPAVLDIILYAGDVGDFQIVFRNSLGVSVNVGPYKWKAQIRKSRTSADHIDLVIDTLHATIGILTVKIPSTVTRELGQGTWGKLSQWDLQCTTMDNSITITILQGNVSCEFDVTR